MHFSGAVALKLARRIVEQPETLGDGDCEALRGGWLGQPVNTATSLGYVAGGSWLLVRLGRTEPTERLAASCYAASVVSSGAGSVAYHGPQFAGAQSFHDLPIVVMLGIGVGVPVARMVRRRPVLGRGGRAAALGAAGLAVVSGLAYLGGRTSSGTCRPDSVLQLHGLWHLGTAAAATLWAMALWPSVTDGGGADRNPQVPDGR